MILTGLPLRSAFPSDVSFAGVSVRKERSDDSLRFLSSKILFDRRLLFSPLLMLVDEINTHTLTQVAMFLQERRWPTTARVRKDEMMRR